MKTKNVNNEEIERSLHDLENEILIDMFGRKGNLINILDLYYFHPIEIKDLHASMYESITPIEYKKKLYQDCNRFHLNQLELLLLEEDIVHHQN
jgi:hypothetical protein